MRVHGNYQEQIAQFLFSLLVAGSVSPRVAWIWGLLYLISRIIYGLAYTRSSANIKYIGPVVLALNIGLCWYAMGLMVYIFIQQKSGAYILDLEKKGIVPKL